MLNETQGSGDTKFGDMTGLRSNPDRVPGISPISEVPKSTNGMGKARVVSLYASLLLSLIQAAIGMLGACEVLTAVGLYSFYQSYIIGEAIFASKNDVKRKTPKRNLWLVGLLVSKIVLLGTCDVLYFSFVKMSKAAQGLLGRPSPYALYAALFSIVLQEILRRYCADRGLENGTAEDRKLMDSFRLSVVASVIAVIGILTARHVTIYGDATATVIIVTVILAPRAVPLLVKNLKLTIDWLFYGTVNPAAAEGGQ